MRVRGAREHNLRSVDADIPRDRLVVITGLSGSGKSSLAFDTIFAEGQRKYMESLSAYARQFLDVLRKPDIDDIEGLPPTIAIEQRSGVHNPRSTVATSTEIYDYLRLLFARCGSPTCWSPTKKRKSGAVSARCGRPIAATSATQIVDAVLASGAGARVMILAPIVSAKKGFHADVLARLRREGFSRARVDGAVVDLREALKEGGDNPLGLGRHERHTVEAVVDRVVVKPEARQRLAESIETALELGDGQVVVTRQGDGDAWTDHLYSDRLACALHPGCAIEGLEPRLFSFNSPFGACPECNGLGVTALFDEALVIPDDTKPIARGAIEPWWKARVWFNKHTRRFLRLFGVAPTARVRDLDPDLRRILVHGATEADLKKRKITDRKGWRGVLPTLQRWYETTESATMREWLGRYTTETPCPACLGDRLRIESLAVFIPLTEPLPDGVAERRSGHGLPTDPGRVNIADFARLSIAQAEGVIGSLDLTDEQRAIAEPIVREVRNRLGFLASVGLGYLSLDRRMGTLSGGEAQRIRLGTQVGSKLVGSCYVLDEPTIGLHPRDNARLIGTLRHLTDIGNTVLVVEHDEEMIRAADHLLDIGPGPGVHGGRVVAQGSIDDLIAEPESVTGRYLAGERRIEVPARRRPVDESRAVVVKGARANNLKSIDAAFPLGGVVCVTGVSGSGKSTLVNDILLAAARKHLHGSRVRPGAHTRVTGLPKIDRVIEVDQSPIGRTPRSNPATYTNVFDEIRRVFAQTKEAKIRGYKPGRFSFNVKGGRCEACQGQGVKKIEMHFLPDVFVECEVCRGARYNRETLEIHYRGRSIAGILDMTVEEACAFFEHHPKIIRFLSCLRDVGLDYVRLGQPSPTLSGGEAQRVKLASELGKGAGQAAALGHTLYILDEPTTGLHFEDVRKLLGVLHRLADAGNTLVVIEHNLDVIKGADWIIDLGPEGGDAGGRVVAAGPPEAVAAHPTSHTGAFLKPLLARAARSSDRTRDAKAGAKPTRRPSARPSKARSRRSAPSRSTSG
ncbi:MAG: excinuclease ABC subunit UvrA [Planctomycetota bacterium]|nr:MAG: excinuclease ABC subunit UvrA [Planctomycetota bacterium]